MTTDNAISFRGGALASAIPLATFLVFTTVLVINGAPATEGMIIGAMLGLSLGMLFARDMAHYSELVFSLMANRVATVAVVCWLWAGAFSGLLQDSGLVEAIVWVGWKLELSGGACGCRLCLVSTVRRFCRNRARYCDRFHGCDVSSRHRPRR